ncbi:unnamed protein product [Zymoseptoria tritici ST99CH_3D7]|uniref:Metallo-beta-lactamase domain-containing protein n=1 Tax=Zymoseptoria tritici (strain ST99CH_3D7) TaxID=1276538 RepID=A0A1X7RDT8_ZYMT9|nr:unnamed protein product [Zymoseptoria tritici ST99CH_3D7]
MSTFDGRVAEFPDIQIDHFRTNAISGRAVRACFLSHVHTDHLVGLESLSYQGPFIYCSPATREVLLRLEKYPHRMNFANGILESRKQTFKHLKRLLKPVPLETPTWIELEPGRKIRVTLFDANHCVGAVMFLIEGEGLDAKAVLYTGDIRSERWWVDSLSRYPVLNRYLSHFGKEPRKRLDMIYLDTTFANKTDRYQHFPSKAEGISELLEKVSMYPRNTRFYFDSWTFGYEDVWQALSAHFNTQIHVDQFKYGVYRSLGGSANGTIAPEYFKLITSHYGNHEQKGCLATGDDDKHQLHSCEQGTGCSIWSKQFVRITPIISRHNGQSMREPGAGGGDGDLTLRHELEFQDAVEFGQLMELLIANLKNDPERCQKVLKMVNDDLKARGTISLDLLDIWPEADDQHVSQEEPEMEDLTPEKVVMALVRRAEKPKVDPSIAEAALIKGGELPKQILFPFSRHASYGELCLLIEAFKPKDIYPCTVVPQEHWQPVHSMGHLFGHIYAEPPLFSHDQIMLQKMNEMQAKTVALQKDFVFSSRQTTPEQHISDPIENDSTPSPEVHVTSATRRRAAVDEMDSTERPSSKRRMTEEARPLQTPKRSFPVQTIEPYSSSPTVVPSPELNHSQARVDLPILSDHIVEASDSPVHVSETPSPTIAPRSTSTKDRPGVDISAIQSSMQESGDGMISSRIASSSSRATSSRSGRPLTPEGRGGSTRALAVGSPQWSNAMRKEAYEASMGSNGRQWSDIELISVRGHQAKEEEL